MSDISLNWGFFDILEIALVLGAPGIALGALCGAFGWRTHRVWGGALGALAGWILCLGAFMIWSETDLSRTLGFGATAALAFERGLPGLVAGAALGARFGRNRIVAGVFGALAGMELWLAGWFYFKGGL